MQHVERTKTQLKNIKDSLNEQHYKLDSLIDEATSRNIEKEWSFREKMRLAKQRISLALDWINDAINTQI